jgi:phenylalanyl-tRNA synthetase alpha subunit
MSPNVLKNCINLMSTTVLPLEWGVERIAMLLYQIGDIRMFMK